MFYEVYETNHPERVVGWFANRHDGCQFADLLEQAGFEHENALSVSTWPIELPACVAFKAVIDDVVIAAFPDMHLRCIWSAVY